MSVRKRKKQENRRLNLEHKKDSNHKRLSSKEILAKYSTEELKKFNEIQEKAICKAVANATSNPSKEELEFGRIRRRIRYGIKS